MNINFYYLVPEDYDNLENLKNEYFIIRELKTQGIDILPIFSLNIHNIKNDYNIQGVLFSSLKIIWKNRNILNYIQGKKIPIFWW